MACFKIIKDEPHATVISSIKVCPNKLRPASFFIPEIIVSFSRVIVNVKNVFAGKTVKFSSIPCQNGTILLK